MLQQDKGDKFDGIGESDETFFEHSGKWSKHLKRPPRKRGGEVKQKGISANKAAVVVSADRRQKPENDIEHNGSYYQIRYRGKFAETAFCRNDIVFGRTCELQRLFKRQQS
jgi:hypothetical protein